jgi:Mor family transcriptional regulator
MKWYDDIKIEDLPGDLQLVARCCSVEIAIELAEKMGSVTIYVRSIDNLLVGKKREYIVKHFTGNNHKQLAIETGVSERYVYDVLADERRKKQSGQKKLFPEI